MSAGHRATTRRCTHCSEACAINHRRHCDALRSYQYLKSSRFEGEKEGRKMMKFEIQTVAVLIATPFERWAVEKTSLGNAQARGEYEMPYIKM